MKIGFMGRTKILLNTINRIEKMRNVEISFIWTSKAEEFYNCSESEFEKKAREIGAQYVCNPIVAAGATQIDFSSVDIVLSLNFVNLVPAVLLNKAKYGILNAHAGDLPRYKGNACPNWAILNNEKEIVLSIHRMSEELDSGPIYVQDMLPIKAATYISEVYDWLDRTIPSSFEKAIEKIVKGEKPKPQKNIRSLRTFPRIPGDAKINWSQQVDEVVRLIRASSRPFDGAYCFLNGDEERTVRIFRAETIDLDYDFYAVNGQILERRDTGFCVSASNKAVLVTDFSLNGMSQKESFHWITKSMRNRLI